MTNEDAIEVLRANYPDAYYEQLREAVDKAIEALKAQDAKDAYSDFLTDIIKKDGYENLKIDDSTTVAEVLDAVVSDLTGTGFDGLKNSPTIIEAEGGGRMTRKEIISGLQMTMDLFLFDPATGETLTPDMLNDINRVTYDACKGAIEALKAED